MQTMLERIADAEQQADRMLEEANARSRERIAAAKVEAEEAVKAAQEIEREKSADALAKAEAEGTAMAKEILKSVDGEIATMRESASARLPEAVSYLMERMQIAL